ncbi:hypothetical protein MNAB215_1218 [Mycobacterium numidiamassiliense]|uniref:Uncharacterized protein n=1 Tax=Mycobacterium numidiamassiliense TaxID=1841861 RepID=A0A2U3P5L5_9MYCO|nr:hypothetical protein MNAB215_1218 [Mycobacterium numidiamassiliense]
MESAASTVTEFFIPDTVTLAQCPTITIVLEIPLTVTTLSLQAMVLFSLMPETLSWPPSGGSGGVDGPALAVADPPADGVELRGEVLGRFVTGAVDVAEEMIDRTPESWCAAKAAITPARTSTPTTTAVPRIHHRRLPPPDFGAAAV